MVSRLMGDSTALASAIVRCCPKFEYAKQAALCGNCVLFVDPTYVDPNAKVCTTSAAIYFKNGRIEAELPVGKSGILVVEV